MRGQEDRTGLPRSLPGRTLTQSLRQNLADLRPIIRREITHEGRVRNKTLETFRTGLLVDRRDPRYAIACVNRA